jgi:hypothetical protein
MDMIQHLGFAKQIYILDLGYSFHLARCRRASYATMLPRAAEDKVATMLSFHGLEDMLPWPAEKPSSRR